jgi:small conductance mechanosensitive channel
MDTTLSQLSTLSNDTNIWIKLFIIIVGSYLLNIILRRVFEKLFSKTNTPKTRTVLQLLQNAISVIILIIAVLTLLSAIGINIMPLLASAGIVGFAVGFGSQAVIKDLISGLFLLTGDIFYEGDIIKIGEIQGKVEKVGIRAITIRDISGMVFTIPNGTIGTIANLTKDWSRANIDIGVSAEHSIDHILAIFKETADEMKKDEHYGNWILGMPKVEGINAIEGNKVTIKTLLKTNQAKKWDLEREFRYRIKKRFETENIKFA